VVYCCRQLRNRRRGWRVFIHKTDNSRSNCADLARKLPVSHTGITSEMNSEQQTFYGVPTGRLIAPRALPRAHQRFVMQVIDTVLAQQGR